MKSKQKLPHFCVFPQNSYENHKLIFLNKCLIYWKQYLLINPPTLTYYHQTLGAGTSNNRENVHEDVDHIQVECEGCKHILFRRERILVASTNHELCVKNQIEGEQQSTETGVHYVQDLKLKKIHYIIQLYFSKFTNKIFHGMKT